MSRAESGLEPEILSQLTARAATLLEKVRPVGGGGGPASAEGRLGGLVGLIMRNAKGLMDQGRYGIVEEWLSTLPAEILEVSPWLLFWVGVCRIHYAPGQGRLFFEKAFALFKEQGDMTGQVLACWGVVQAINGDLADFRPLEQWLPVLEEF